MTPLWWLTKDGDGKCLEMYERHYSAYRYRDGRKRLLFAGPGFKIVLRTWEGDAFFVWRKFKDDSGQVGINCAAFRNESPHKSSDLIRQADAIADFCFPRERPGYCFIVSGWKRCGKTKSGKLILERA